mmetsp:Transcript_2044/g.3741  ORF Transcript_2044/g.3741 Transcript_2044/m.3741 type:complete len:88 (+) Transcript_2044:434-697(+)
MPGRTPQLNLQKGLPMQKSIVKDGRGRASSARRLILTEQSEIQRGVSSKNFGQRSFAINHQSSQSNEQVQFTLGNQQEPREVPLRAQ